MFPLDTIIIDAIHWINGNIASIKVFEHLKFVNEGVRREAAYFKDSNEYKDFLDYGLLNSEYKE